MTGDPEAPDTDAGSGAEAPEGDARGVIERIAALERTVQRHAERLDDVATDTGTGGVGRRSVLGATGAAGLLALGAGRVAADPQGRIGTADSPARVVHTERLGGGVVGGTVLNDLLGDGLTTETTDTGATLSAGPAANDHVGVVGDFGLEVESVDRFELSGALRAEDLGDGVVELDADDDSIPPAWEDADGDALLEPRETGIEGVAGVDRVESTGSLVVAAEGTEEFYRSGLSLSTGDQQARATLRAAESEGTSGRLTLTQDRLFAEAGGISLTAPQFEGIDSTVDLSGGTVSVDGDLLELVSANLDLGGNELRSGLNLAGNSLFGIAQRSNVTSTELRNRELLADSNRGGSGNFALLFRDGSGTVQYFDADGTVSSARYKQNIRPWSADPYGVLELDAREYEPQRGAEPRGPNRHNTFGFVAEEAAETAPWAVEFVRVTEGNADRFHAEGHEGEWLPDRINYEMLTVAHNEILSDLVADTDALTDRVAELTADDEAAAEDGSAAGEAGEVGIVALREALSEKDERIDELEAEIKEVREENERLRDRLAAVEAQLGLDSAAGDAGRSPADD